MIDLEEAHALGSQPGCPGVEAGSGGTGGRSNPSMVVEIIRKPLVDRSVVSDRADGGASATIIRNPACSASEMPA